MGLFRFRKSSLPPAVQRPIGLQHDQGFAAPEPGIVEKFVGYWRGHAVYRERAPKAIWIPDPRAERNRQIAAQRRAARGEANPLWLDDGPPRMAGMAPAPYDFTTGQPDMSTEARALIGAGATEREFGPRYRETEPVIVDESARQAAQEIAATAAMLSGGSRWTVIPPRGSDGRRDS